MDNQKTIDDFLKFFADLEGKENIVRRFAERGLPFNYDTVFMELYLPQFHAKDRMYVSRAYQQYVASLGTEVISPKERYTQDANETTRKMKR